MEKSVLHIHLMNRPVVRECNRENRPDSGRFDDRAEGLTIINSMLLSKTVKDPTSLVAVEGAVGAKLVGENPLAGDDV